MNKIKEVEVEGEETIEIDKTEEYEYNIYPLDSIRIEKGRMSLFEIKRRCEKNDIVLDPDFQREGVWEKKQKLELIESILMGIPIPVFYFFESKDAKIQVVDGRQRITAIIDFMDNRFTLKQSNIINNIENKKFSDLSPMQQRKIEDYQIDTYTIQPPTPEQVKFDIFDRVNRGGTRLNNQEMRNALYQGNSTELIKKLTNLESFKQATNYSIKSNHMKDRYIILRFIAFYMYYSNDLKDIEYKGNINDFLSKVMVFLNDKDCQHIIYELESLFDQVMNFAYKSYGSDIFRFNSSNDGKKRPINMALFESLSFLFALCIKNNITPSKEDIDILKKEFDNSGKFMKGIDSIANTEYRFNIIKQFAENKA